MRIPFEFTDIILILKFFYEGNEGSYKDIAIYYNKGYATIRAAGIALKNIGIVYTKTGSGNVKLIKPLNEIKIYDILNGLNLSKNEILFFKDISVEEYFETINSFNKKQIKLEPANVFNIENIIKENNKLEKEVSKLKIEITKLIKENRELKTKLNKIDIILNK